MAGARASLCQSKQSSLSLDKLGDDVTLDGLEPMTWCLYDYTAFFTSEVVDPGRPSKAPLRRDDARVHRVVKRFVALIEELQCDFHACVCDLLAPVSEHNSGSETDLMEF